MSKLPAGTPIIVFQLVHMREEQEQLRQKIDRLESLVDSQSVLLQEEMKKSSRRAREARRYHRETRAQLEKMENMLERLAAREASSMITAASPPAPPPPSTPPGSPPSPTSLSSGQPLGVGEPQDSMGTGVTEDRQATNPPANSRGPTGVNFTPGVLATPTKLTEESTDMQVDKTSPPTDTAQPPLSSASALPSTSAVRPVAHHLLATISQLSALTPPPPTPTSLTAPPVAANRESSPDDDTPLALRSKSRATLAKKTRDVHTNATVAPRTNRTRR